MIGLLQTTKQTGTVRWSRERTRNMKEKRSRSSHGAKKSSRSNGDHATQTQTTSSQGQTELIKCHLREKIMRELKNVNCCAANEGIKGNASWGGEIRWKSAK